MSDTPYRPKTLRELREERNMPLTALAAQVGVHFTYVNKWEIRGRVPPKWVPKVARALGVRPSEIWPELGP